MPLEFLRRRGNDPASAAAPVQPAFQPGPASHALPEEVVAQEHQLRINYAAKTSEGVRIKAGPRALADLPDMLVGIAKSDIEVIDPLPIEYSQATPAIVPLRGHAMAFLQGDSGVGAIGFIAAMAVSSTIVDVSPFSTNGALVLASAQGVDRDVFFRKLLTYGAIVTLVAPVVVWLLFVVL